MTWRLLVLLAALWAGPTQAQSCRPVIEPARACPNGLSIAAVGDMLLHRPLQARGYASPDGFRRIWLRAEPFLRRADIAYANLEGPVAAGITAGFAQANDPGPVLDGRIYTGYPRFNYHARIAGQLKAAGFDIVSTANNHAMDRGPLGADRTLAALDAAGLAHTGTIRAGAPRAFVTHVPTRAGPVAFIACSYDTNGISDPGRQVLRCFRDRAELLALTAQQANRPDVAAVIVTPHWGTEYSHSPNWQQRDLARALAAAGATAIIGAHPHVIQPMEWLDGPRGRVLVAYSTGNFVSAQLNSLSRRTGILAWLDLCPTAGRRHSVASAGWLPLVMYRTDQGPWLDVAGTGATGLSAQARALAARLLPAGGTRLDLVCPVAASRDASVLP